MPRRLVAALSLISCVALPARVVAQDVSTQGAAATTKVALPDTPAGAVVRDWLDVFASGDTARILGWYRRYQPERIAQGTINYRLASGGFEVLSIERSEPRHIEMGVKERNTPMVAYARLELAPSDPPRIASSTLTAMGANASLAVLRVDAAARTRVIEGAIAQLDSFYVFPEVAKRVADSLRVWNRAGRYASDTRAIGFAERMHEDVRTLSRDKHMGVRFIERPIPPRSDAPPPPPSPADIARARSRADQDNCAFVKAERLEGNIGYLKFDGFFDPEICGETASAAMTFLAGTRALIVDMRENGGGSPGMVAYVSSYLFSKRTHLNDIWNRRTGRTEEYWTRDSVTGRRFGGEKPVYVLTAARTFSAAEEFTYNLKALKRATIVGEVTGGGAHPVAGYRIDDHFMIAVPNARSINPITRTNWEGVGVTPDVRVPAGEALDAALRLLREPRR
jgi:retinol-binding protein 3